MDYRIVYIGAETIFGMPLLTLYYMYRISNPGQRPGKLDILYVVFIITTVLDSLWILIDGNPAYRGWHIMLETADFCLATLIGYLWFLYTLDLFPAKSMKIRKYRYVLSLPMIIAFILILSSFKTGFVFTVDENGMYSRGPLNTWIFVIGYIYMVMGSIIALRCRREAILTVDKKRFLIAAFFPVPILIFSLVQIFLPPGLPALQGSAVISLLLVYSTSQNFLVTRDHLTQLPNRVLFERVLANQLAKSRSDDDTHLYLIAGDIDKFKYVNDTYGHPFGDKVLVNTANVLREFFSKHDGVTFRTGGDEFMIICDTNKKLDIESLQSELNTELEKIKLLDDVTPSMSLGMTEYDGNTDFLKIINLADEQLYLAKARNA